MQDIESGSVDLVLTSPPYDNLRDYGNDFKGWGEHIWKPCLDNIKRLLKDGGVCVWVVGDATFNGSETGTSFKQALYAKEIGFNLHDTMIYQKNSAPANGKRYQPNFEYMFVFCNGKILTFNPIKEKCKKFGTHRTSGHRNKAGVLKERDSYVGEYKTKNNIWEYYAGNGEGDKIAQQHPARFPEKLAEDHIISWSNETDTVLDCFMGSGTTGKACVMLNRNFIGIEQDADYFKIAQDRIADAQKQPTLAMTA
jgi:site-specific DNA-methyltransferase (adenine-specific)